jgi:hypothetical protein
MRVSYSDSVHLTLSMRQRDVLLQNTLQPQQSPVAAGWCLRWSAGDPVLKRPQIAFKRRRLRPHLHPHPVPNCSP